MNALTLHSPLPAKTGPSLLLSVLLTARRKGRGMLPAAQASFTARPTGQAHLRRYRDELGFVSEAVPLSYLYLLAQRSQLALMFAPDFPYAVPGMVHVANQMAWTNGGERAIDVDAACDVEVGVTGEPPTATGAQFVTFHTRVLQGGEERARCDSRYLARRAPPSGKRPQAVEQVPSPPAGAESIGRYALPGNAGRRYAALSGDINPIHLWRWSARLLGFKRPIIHGMHTVARLTAIAEHRFKRPVHAMAIDFLKPVPLPADVSLYARAESGSRLIVEAQTPRHVALRGTLELAG